MPELFTDPDADLFAIPGKAGKRPATRRDDHATSISAADKAALAQNTIRFRVTKFALDAGPRGFIDDDLVAADPDAPESSWRKRRTELTQDGWLFDTGRTKPNRSGNAETVWVHRDHVPPHPLLAVPPTGDKAELKAKARDRATFCDQLAKQLYAEGRGPASIGLQDAADMLRQLSV